LSVKNMKEVFVTWRDTMDGCWDSKRGLQVGLVYYLTLIY